MNRIRLYWRRIFRRPVITGPYRLYVRPTPTGAMLDVEHYLVAVLETLADNPDLLELLDRMSVDREQARGHDGWEPEGLLPEQLVTALGHELPLYGGELVALADRLQACAPEQLVWLPEQRREGGAAA
ncbi:hypothetical protein [Streptomyces broussonetiae]|uniref:Uncharacterized protein n=1 Tax=Streptomyces broussonetiae TaxID=2686304 RepID=A0ABV5E5M9_9ACTN